jgi:hypothetical protein
MRNIRRVDEAQSTVLFVLLRCPISREGCEYDSTITIKAQEHSEVPYGTPHIRGAWGVYIWRSGCSGSTARSLVPIRCPCLLVRARPVLTDFKPSGWIMSCKHIFLFMLLTVQHQPDYLQRIFRCHFRTGGGRRTEAQVTDAP